jgi:hypothetical protein
MIAHEALITLWWLTVAKVFIGAALGAVLIGSLYKFKKSIMTTFGILLISNLLTLYLIMVLVSKSGSN